MSATIDPRPGRAAIRDATVLRLIGAVPAVQGRVWRGRAWDVADGNLPALLVYVFRERKALISEAGSAPQFRVTVPLVIHCRAQAEDVPADDVTEAAAAGALVEDALDALTGAVEAALLTDPDWVAQFERIPAVDTDTSIVADADRPTGEAVMTFTLQWTETFQPVLPYALETIALRALSPLGDTLVGADVLIETE